MSARKRNNHEAADLNLTAFVDVFVTLIVFLLLSTIFTQLGSLKVETPGTKTAEAQAADRSKIKFLVAELNNKKISFQLVDGTGKADESLALEIPSNSAEAFKAFEVKLNEKVTSLESIILRVGSSSQYQEALSLVEKLRGTKLTENVVLAVASAEEEGGGDLK